MNWTQTIQTAHAELADVLASHDSRISMLESAIALHDRAIAELQNAPEPEEESNIGVDVPLSMLTLEQARANLKVLEAQFSEPKPPAQPDLEAAVAAACAAVSAPDTDPLCNAGDRPRSALELVEAVLSNQALALDAPNLKEAQRHIAQAQRLALVLKKEIKK